MHPICALCCDACVARPRAVGRDRTWHGGGRRDISLVGYMVSSHPPHFFGNPTHDDVGSGESDLGYQVEQRIRRICAFVIG